MRVDIDKLRDQACPASALHVLSICLRCIDMWPLNSACSRCMEAPRLVSKIEEIVSRLADVDEDRIGFSLIFFVLSCCSGEPQEEHKSKGSELDSAIDGLSNQIA